MPYFDHSATTKPLDSVITTISKSMERDYYNPASLYDAAKDVEKKIKNAYIDCLLYTSDAADDCCRV